MFKDIGKRGFEVVKKPVDTRWLYTKSNTGDSGNKGNSETAPEASTSQSQEATEDASIIDKGIIFTKIKHHPESYAQFTEKKMTYYNIFAKARNTSLERYISLLDQHSKKFIPRDSTVCMRINPHDLKTILTNNDSFKPRYVTGTSSDLSDDATRLANEEHRVGNYGPEISGELHPIYGYITRKDQPLGIKGKEHYLDQYGYATIVFKEDIKQRTSFIVGDSVDSNAKAVPLARPDGDCFPLGTPITAEASPTHIQEEDPLNRNFDDSWPYVEAQIHYGATLQEVAAVYLSGSAANDMDLQNMLQKANIPCYKSDQKN